jgi:peptidoglycan hydrolase-like protein with peptidoglycan-binding domain
MMGRAGRRAARAAVAVTGVLAVGAATAAATGYRFSGAKSTAQTQSDLPPATAKVTRQTLADTQQESGTLGYGDDTTLSARLGGTVTGLPVPGTAIKRGQALYRVDNTPVLLLYGTLPAYRALATGTKGADVKEFEQNLYALGYRGFTVDDTYSASTATAVKQWQDDLGLTKTGTVELGRVAYAAGALRVDALQAAVGDVAGPGADLFSYTGTARVVTVELSVDEQRLAIKGAAVTLTLPDGRNTTGKITNIVTVIKPAEGNQDAKTVVDVTVAVSDGKLLAGLDAATIMVGFTASQRENVLTVPVAALLALSEGGYGVQVVDGTSTKIVAVETGLFASGRVEVTGEGLTEGMTVGMPS